jgi:hypothetical protein
MEPKDYSPVRPEVLEDPFPVYAGEPTRVPSPFLWGRKSLPVAW